MKKTFVTFTLLVALANFTIINFAAALDAPEMLHVPVLVQKMARAELVKESDISWMEVPAAQVKFDTITTKDKIIGQVLKRDIKDGVALRERDLQKPQIISRNSTVNILFNTDTISIKTIGIALDNGGQGDVIRVRNSSSNKIIQGIVQNNQDVSVVVNDGIAKTAKFEDGNYVR